MSEEIKEENTGTTSNNTVQPLPDIKESTPDPKADIQPASEPMSEIQPGMVMIEQDKLDRMVKDIDILKTISDKRRMAKWMSENKGQQLPVMNLRELNGKIIVGWRSTKNNPHIDTRTGHYIEDQNTEIIYEDGTTEEMPLKVYYENYRTIPAEQISKTEEAGEVLFKLRRIDNGEEYEVGSAFVN